MKTIQRGEDNISYLSLNFEDWFDEMPVKRGIVLGSKKLTRYMNDGEILAELKPEPCTLGDMIATLQVIGRDGCHLFYIKDNARVLRVVYVCWVDDGWEVYACSIEDPRWWRDGYQVFSRRFSDTPSILESRVERLETLLDELRGLLNN